MVQVPDGWGSIYCSSWFGDYRNIQRSLYYKPDCVLPAGVQNYIDRVEADSGTAEAKECLANELIRLGYDLFNNESSIILQAFIDRVAADSGVMEADRCVENGINDLKNI